MVTYFRRRCGKRGRRDGRLLRKRRADRDDMALGGEDVAGCMRVREGVVIKEQVEILECLREEKGGGVIFERHVEHRLDRGEARGRTRDLVERDHHLAPHLEVPVATGRPVQRVGRFGQFGAQGIVRH